MQHQQIAADHRTAGDAQLGAVTNDQRPGRGQVAQCFKGALRLALLRQGQSDHGKHRAEQEGRLGGVTDDQVNGSCGQQHQEHGLAHDIESDAQQRARLAAGQCVGAVPRHRTRRLLPRQAGKRSRGAGRLPRCRRGVGGQWAISTGRVIDRSTVREAPPRTHSRARLWP